MDPFWNSVMTVAASLCAGLSVFFATICAFRIIQRIEMERPSEEAVSLPLPIRILLPLAVNMIPIVRSGHFNNSLRKYREMIVMAGFEEQIDAEKFISVNILITIFAAIFTLIFFAGGQILLGILAFVLLFLYPKWWLNSAIKKRHLEIQKALPNVLDLLTLSVEAGKDFLTSLRDILLRRRRDALSEELERTFQEIQLGKQRRIALRELSRRVQQPDLTTVLNAIIQADELGVSIAHILKIQGDQLRIKRFSRAEKLANEAPVKILFPLALFILPAVVLILLGPLLLKSFKTIFN